MLSNYTTRTTCRVCGSSDLTPLFSLGEQHVSDFVSADRVHAGAKCPIDIELCRACTLVQAKYTAPQELLYSRHYWYRSGVTRTMRDALRDVTAAAERLVDLHYGDYVLDIGSNDGTLLRSYSKPVCRIGFEPAMNLFAEGMQGLQGLVPDFWSYETWKAFTDVSGTFGKGAQAKVVTACGMFYDLDDPNQFIADVAKVLTPDGVFIAQLMCLKQTLDAGDVGNFCHEHLEFYSLDSLRRLLGIHGLEIFDIEENGVNGGSYRLYCCQAMQRAPSDRVGAAFMKELELKLHDPFKLKHWFDALRRNKEQCVEFIADQVSVGKSVWVYGASTKGNTILQWYGLNGRQPDTYLTDDGGPQLIDAAADRSPEKWGKFTVGTGIPIKSEEEFRKAVPDYALVLPYAFLPEFVEREREWLNGGGTFIVPLPEFSLVTKDGGL